MVRRGQLYSSDIVPIHAHPDINLLPLDQLPVQKVLSFTQPPTPVTVAYLSAICRAEGIQRDDFLSTVQTELAVDLRLCINQCQLGITFRFLSTAHLQETTRDNWEDVLEKRAHSPRWALPPLDGSQHKALFRCLAKHTDNISYLDFHSVLRVDTVSELLAFGNPCGIKRRCSVFLGCRIGQTRRRQTMSLGTRSFRPVT